MKAVVCDRYGPPDVLRLEEVPKPVPGDGEVLVKVHAAGVNAADWHILRADPFLVRLSFGFLRPRFRILGADVAGTVETVGADVTSHRPGDEVFADLSECGWGGFAEYACAPEEAWVSKPSNRSFEETAAVPLAAVTALQGLRDHGKIRQGQKVLVNGASGGVGSFAVQIARSFGARVTGVCSTRNLDMVRSIGADHVIDYTREDATKGGQLYDLILDAAAYRSMLDYRRSLSPGGIYVLVGGDRLFQAMFLGPLVSAAGSRKMGSMLHRPVREDLVLMKELLEAGKVTPVIDRSYPLSEVPDAVRYQEEGRARGKVVIRVSEDH